LSIPALVNELCDLHREELETAAQLPIHATYRFDRTVSQTTDVSCPAQKMTRRTVVSLNFSRFQAKEVVRQEKCQGQTRTHHSPQLAAVVPKGGRYAYDLIAHVGVQSFLKGRPLQDVWQQLNDQRPSLNIPFSSLYDVQRKFLYYFGQLHAQAAGRIKEYLQQRGGVTWLMDGTLEPGTPLYFGVKEAEEGLFLSSGKIATENVDDIARCLAETRQRYGSPDRILHDLSEVMASACVQALPNVPHFICHYHLLSDVGGDLYQDPQAALSKLLRRLKLQPRLHEQRHGQTRWLRQNLDKPEDCLVLMDLLNGKRVEVKMTGLLGREVLLACHLWLMDYAADGSRQGFPFDPYLLYFHRRVVQADAALDRLFRQPAVSPQAPKVLTNFGNMLKQYLTNPQVIDAAQRYEKAWDIFQNLRNVLRLSLASDAPLHDRYLLNVDEQRQVHESLTELRETYRQRCHEEGDSDEPKPYHIVVDHLDKYWSYLLPQAEVDGEASKPSPERTTNGLESHWGQCKRGRRKTQAHPRPAGDATRVHVHSQPGESPLYGIGPRQSRPTAPKARRSRTDGGSS